MSDTSNLIQIISAASDRYGDKLVAFMERYRLTGLCEAKEWQLKEYIRQEGLNYAQRKAPDV